MNSGNPYHPLSLTSIQITAANALDDALDSDQSSDDLLDLVHSLAFALMSSCQPKVADDQLQCPQVIFLVLANVRLDGSLNTPEMMAKCLSKFSWGMRATAVYDAQKCKGKYTDGMFGYALFFLSHALLLNHP